MDCGDAGHILISKHVAEDLEEYEHWRPLLHDLGACEVKHGVRVTIVNLYANEVGNPQLPKVPRPEEAQGANPLGGDDGSVARARGNRRWHRNIFPLSRAIDAASPGKKHRRAAVSKSERRSRERVFH